MNNAPAADSELPHSKKFPYFNSNIKTQNKMAKAQSIQLISGRLHDITFKVRDGKQCLSMAPFHTQ